jgi:hypothetical protein
MNLCAFSAEEDLKPITHLLAVNICSRAGFKLLHGGLNFLVQDAHFWR